MAPTKSLLLAALLLAGLACAGEPQVSTITASGATIEVRIGATGLAASNAEILKWVEASAASVVDYYGKFPVDRYRVIVLARTRGRGIGGSTRIANDGVPQSVVRVPGAAEADDLGRDWVMTHEMVHLAFPWMEDQHHWIEEGIATYVEPIARVRTGRLSVEQHWLDHVRGMPQGLPGPGDEGLDHTHTWGRTYWGGAIFCLVADMRIRERTHNRYGLGDALRGVQKAGGQLTVDWPIERALVAGDEAVGGRVLRELYREWKDKPVKVDLDATWKRLGIIVDGDSVRFDDNAPLAAIRKAMTAEKQER